MSTTLTIRDESATGDTLHELTLELLEATITVRDLIRERVFQEVKDFNARKPEHFKGLVRPADAAISRDGFKLETHRAIDWEQQYEQALDGFEGNRVIVLVDDRQAESLDEQITITPSTGIAFLKLVPLVGG